MDVDKRIQQFRQMSEADPDNELGHFSLGKAYVDAARFDEAIEPFRKALELNPNLSKAYQMLGEALDKAGQREKAIEALKKGVTVADAQGDRMPRDAMADLLKSWNADVPDFAPKDAGPASPPGEAAAAGFSCARCSSPGGKLEKPPFKGALGEKIFAHVCQNCWREWIAMGTKVINELGLVLSTKEGQDTYDQYMVEFLQLDDG